MSKLEAFSALSILSFATAAAGGDLPRLPSLTAASAEGSTALELEELEIAVTIQGHLARTEYVMTYRNDLDRELRADFLFPLPAGAHLSDVGLYFGDRLRRASAVGRDLGRRAYENIVPRFVSNGRDPILAEWTTGNSFRYDVYPIPRRGSKKIYLAYDEELSDDAYELDLRYRNRFRRFRIEVEADGPFDQEGGLELDCYRERCAFEGEGITVDARLRVRGSKPATPVALMELGSDGLYYLSLPLEAPLLHDPYPAAGHLTLLWDASGTTAGQSLSVLQAFLLRLVDAQARPVDVTVVPFHAWKEPSIDIARADTESGRDALLAALQAISPVGGTYLPALWAELRNVPANSRIVLVTDGQSSMGPHDDLARSLASLAELRREVLVVNSSPALDVEMLEGIARATRGWYVDLRGADERAITSHVQRVMNFPRFLTEATLEGALDRGISQPAPVGGPGRLSLTARFAKPMARGEVLLRFDGPRGGIFERLRFVTVRTRDIGLVRSHWARDRLEDLLVSADGASIREHGMKHHLLTPETSLVVLETWRDYLTHGVDMPADVREDYDAVLENQKARRREWEREWRRIIRREGSSMEGLWTLAGQVEDQYGGVLPGVLVTVSSWERGTESTAVTDEEGRYRVLATSPPGAFSLRAELRGFQTLWYEFSDGLPSGTELEPFVMGLAGVCESVTVSLGGGPPPSQLPREKTELPSGGTMLPPASTPHGASEAWRFSHWLHELGLEGTPLPQSWANTRRGLAKRTALELAKSDRSDRDVLEMYVAARSVLGPSKWLAAESARSLYPSRPAVAARIASELVEHDPEEPGVARTVARLFDDWGRRELAEPLLLRALEQAPHELQSFLHWIRFGYRNEGVGVWDWVAERLGDQPPLALRRDVERALRSRVGPAGPNASLEVELVWDGRSVDLDLEVLEPSGRRALHRNRDQPRPAGWLSANEPSYGPEVYSILNRASGTYTIRVRYARAGQMELEAATLGLVTVSRKTQEGEVERSTHPFVLGERDETWELRLDRIEN